FAWCDTASLPYYGLSPDMKKHLIQVVGVSGYDPATGTYLLDDRAQVPISIDAVALAEARATQPYMKQRLLVVKKPTAKADPAGAIREGLAAGAEYMLHPPIKNFGLPAIQKWAELANHPKDKKGWPQVLKPGSHLYLGQRAAFEAIELQGGSGGAMRGLFARTLEEAAAVCKIPELKKAAKRYDELAALWTSLADAALPDKVKPFKQTKELMRKKESLFLAKGAGAAKDLAKLQGQLDDLGESMKAGYPWGDADAKAFYQDMHDRLVQIHGAEESALGMVIDAL
ncbi:MAG TPA: DUF4872 domain-containing protein, partial [bacterium]|nr:DUF4872 domain-containing protein [bacterium]